MNTFNFRMGISLITNSAQLLACRFVPISSTGSECRFVEGRLGTLSMRHLFEAPIDVTIVRCNGIILEYRVLRPKRSVTLYEFLYRVSEGFIVDLVYWNVWCLRIQQYVDEQTAHLSLDRNNRYIYNLHGWCFFSFGAVHGIGICLPNNLSPSTPRILFE